MSYHAHLGRNDSGCSSQSGHQFELKIFIKDVHDKNGKKRALTVRPWATIKDVKDLLCKHLHVPPAAQAIFFGPLLTSSRELPNYRTLQDAGIYRSGETLLLKIKASANSNSAVPVQHSITSLRYKANDICVSSSFLDLTPKSLQRLVQQARRGLAMGLKPVLAPDGSGGSYVLSDARKIRVGVFKPADEEPFAENNPRGYVLLGSEEEGGLRKGIRPGELCLRECAAYLLDHEGFSGVPMTTLAEARHPALHVNGAHWTLSEGGASVGIHSFQTTSNSTESTRASIPTAGKFSAVSHQNDLIKKVGSFQEFIHAECTMDDLSPSKVSVEDVHRIAILDIRLMNADRNAANILCQRIPDDPDNFRLVPIDHGYSLRSVIDVAWFDWCWLDWPQTKEPLSKNSREYVLNLDIEADARLLRERLGMENDVLDCFRASCYVLKAGVRSGLSLFDIASGILCRNDPSGEIPSKLEILTSMASELALSAVHNGRFHHSTASLAIQEQLTSSDLFGKNNHPSKLFVTSRPVSRSLSSSVFSSVTTNVGQLSTLPDDLNFQTAPPAMVQSSLSDNSSNDEYSSESAPEEYEAEDWAAAVLAVADESMNCEFLRERSTSESTDLSDSSKLSKSPIGFWYVRPGASTLSMGDKVDMEPSCTSLLSQSKHSPKEDVDEFRLSNVINTGVSASNLSKLFNESDIGFDDEDDISESYTASEFTNSTTTVNRLSATVQSHGTVSSFENNRAFTRSMSYSAFSSSSNIDDHNRYRVNRRTVVRKKFSLSQEDDLLHTYFLKFVDLLVVREIERLVHCK